jgi:hypothetical protein
MTMNSPVVRAQPEFKGDSYRLREKKKAGLLGRRPKPAGESGELEEVGAEAWANGHDG